MKKILTIMLILVLVLSLVVACGGTGGIDDTSSGNGDENNSNPPDASTTPSSEPQTEPEDEAPPAASEAQPATSEAPPSLGETMIFEYAGYTGFSVEVTNVVSEEVKTGTSDDGSPREFTGYVLSPGAQLTVISADMTDGSLTESGQPGPNWYIDLNFGDSKIPITDDMPPLEITSDMTGIYSEGSYILTFEFRD